VFYLKHLRCHLVKVKIPEQTRKGVYREGESLSLPNHWVERGRKKAIEKNLQARDAKGPWRRFRVKGREMGPKESMSSGRTLVFMRKKTRRGG